jgi:hypothetical protein
MRAGTPKRLMRRPRSYLEYLTEANRIWLLGWGATFHRAPAAAGGGGGAG